MLLAIDIGNSTTKFGVFDHEKLTTRFTIPTGRQQTSKVISAQINQRLPERVSAVIISSVVPETNASFQDFFENELGLKPVFVDNTFDSGLKNKYNPPSAVGADRLIAAFAASEKYGKPCIVCDFGTATTIDAVNSKAEYLGGIIAPGMRVMADALFLKTSKLPQIELEKPAKIIGDSTVSAIQSGIYYGYAGLVEKILQKIIFELGDAPKIIATGGFAATIAESVEMIEIVDENLMLEGLRLIHEKMRNKLS